MMTPRREVLGDFAGRRRTMATVARGSTRTPSRTIGWGPDPTRQASRGYVRLAPASVRLRVRGPGKRHVPQVLSDGTAEEIRIRNSPVAVGSSSTSARKIDWIRQNAVRAPHAHGSFETIRMTRPTRAIALAALAIFFAMGSVVPGADAFAIGLRFNETECFSKYIEKSRDLSGRDGRDMEFKVIGKYVVSKEAKFLEETMDDFKLSKLEVVVRQPDGKIIHRETQGKSRGEFEVTARGVGTYSLCFTNAGNKGRESWTHALPHQKKDQEMTSYVRVHYFQPVHVEDHEAMSVAKEQTEANKRRPELPSGDKSLGKRGALFDDQHAKDVKALALNLKDEISLMRQELFYLKNRAARHKKTADSNNRRTLYWTVIEVLVLCAVAAVQVLTVRHFFTKDSNAKPARMHGPGTMGGGGGFGGMGGMMGGSYISAVGGGYGGGAPGGGMVPPPPAMGGGGGGHPGHPSGGPTYGMGGASVYGDQSGLGNRGYRTAG